MTDADLIDQVRQARGEGYTIATCIGLPGHGLSGLFDRTVAELARPQRQLCERKGRDGGIGTTGDTATRHRLARFDFAKTVRAAGIVIVAVDPGAVASAITADREPTAADAPAALLALSQLVVLAIPAQALVARELDPPLATLLADLGTLFAAAERLWRQGAAIGDLIDLGRDGAAATRKKAVISDWQGYIALTGAQHLLPQMTSRTFGMPPLAPRDAAPRLRALAPFATDPRLLAARAFPSLPQQLGRWMPNHRIDWFSNDWLEQESGDGPISPKGPSMGADWLADWLTDADRRADSGASWVTQEVAKARIQIETAA